MNSDCADPEHKTGRVFHKNGALCPMAGVNSEVLVDGFLWGKDMNNGRTSLDMETKVALMAALVYDGDCSAAVTTALELEQESHRQVVNLFRERKLSRAD